MKWFYNLKRTIARKLLTTRTHSNTTCKCPRCKLWEYQAEAMVLIMHNEVKQTAWTYLPEFGDAGAYSMTCVHCGHISNWTFAIAPVALPILDHTIRSLDTSPSYNVSPVDRTKYDNECVSEQVLLRTHVDK